MFFFSLCFPNPLIFLYSNCSFSFFLIFLLLPSPAPFLNTAVLQGSILTRILCPHSLGDFNASHAFSYHLWVKTIKFIILVQVSFLSSKLVFPLACWTSTSISTCHILQIQHFTYPIFHLSVFSQIHTFSRVPKLEIWRSPDSSLFPIP